MKSIKAEDLALSVQHLFAMFGATILVPLITGLNPSLALFTAGLGTLIFHIVTKMKVPVFLGSSFAFLPAVSAIVFRDGAISSTNISAVQGGIIAAGAVYFIFAALAYLIGPRKIKKLFPPIVTGPVIVVIGITLSATAISDAFGGGDFSNGIVFDGGTAKNALIAIFTIIVISTLSTLAKGFFKLVPILIGIVAGYILCLLLSAIGVYSMDFAAVSSASWINIPYVTTDANGVPFMSLPTFELGVILSVAPVAVVTLMEHIGDITTNGAVVGKDFFESPGLHRTLIGDGLATAVAGFFGGPPNTTYSENTGVLATTKNYNPALLRYTAVLAMVLGLFGKFGAFLQTIPSPVKGGVEIVLFGIIAAIGVRTLSEAKLDFTDSRNLIIVALILVLGLGINAMGNLTVNIGDISLSISGLFVAVVAGVAANIILPDRQDL
ncbi:MAG: uracil-xanthine permease family protein [Clostridiales bacterium]|nr:uracil-xanthine permease family protein [Clostridiales bacterium]